MQTSKTPNTVTFYAVTGTKWVKIYQTSSSTYVLFVWFKKRQSQTFSDAFQRHILGEMPSTIFEKISFLFDRVVSSPSASVI